MVEAEVVAEVDEAVEAEAVVDEIVAEVEAELVEAEVVAEVVEPATEAEAESTAGTEPTDSSDRVVRVLSVGMEVPGVVKRTTDFGAFVDIGVGRDGLIHISELSTRRVAKVSDVVKEGQEVTAWIKELDRSRNRISLTLIAPGTKTIRDLKRTNLSLVRSRESSPMAPLSTSALAVMRCFTFARWRLAMSTSPRMSFR